MSTPTKTNKIHCPRKQLRSHLTDNLFHRYQTQPITTFSTESLSFPNKKYAAANSTPKKRDQTFVHTATLQAYCGKTTKKLSPVQHSSPTCLDSYANKMLWPQRCQSALFYAHVLFTRKIGILPELLPSTKTSSVWKQFFPHKKSVKLRRLAKSF